MDTRIFLAIPACLAVGMLVYHSFRANGARWSLIFFLFTLAVMIDKEKSQQRRIDHGFDPDYIVSGGFLRLFDAPVVVLVGWIFTFYLSWFLARSILERSRRMRVYIVPHIILASLFVATFSMAMEITGINLGWWEWTGPFNDPVTISENFIFVQQGGRMTAWMFHSLIIYCPFFLLENSSMRKITGISHPVIGPAADTVIKLVISVAFIASMYISTNLSNHKDILIIGTVYLLLLVFFRKTRFLPTLPFVKVWEEDGHSANG